MENKYQYREKLLKIDSQTAEKFSDRQRTLRALEVFMATGRTLSNWQKEPPLKLIEAEWEKIFVNPEREELYNRCNARFLDMIKEGAVDEVKKLISQNYPSDVPILKALGVLEISSFLRGEITEDEMIAKASQATRNYAKRQVTWFKHQYL